MKTYNYKEEPIKVFGVVDFDKKKKMQRLPDELNEKLPNLGKLGIRCPGARIGFRTDSKHISLRVKLQSASQDGGMSIVGAQSVCIFEGDRPHSTYVGPMLIHGYNNPVIEGTLMLKGEMEDILIWLPRNEVIEDFDIMLDDDSRVEPPTPYKYPKPILYYGSSITEGGCCCVPYNAYTALISRRLDVDFYNFGFSGSAKGNLTMAEYISTVDMSIFVMDYDYNAPTAEHLLATHEPFFKLIRSKCPELPVVFLSRPAVVMSEDDIRRRDIVYRTYENAVKSGDKNVYFCDGLKFFPDDDKPLCSNDTCHPNDYGFHMMAKAIEPVIREILINNNK